MNMQLFSAIFLLLLLFNSCGNKKYQDNIDNAFIINNFMPLLVDNDENDLFQVVFEYKSSEATAAVREVIIKFGKRSILSSLSSVYARFCVDTSDHTGKEFFGETNEISRRVVIKGNTKINNGKNTFIIGFRAKPDADLLNILSVASIELVFDNNMRKTILPQKDQLLVRFAHVIRKSGQDGCDTYRIPGLITTKKGTLIAVYDVRYKNSRDLQGDIDIGMSRSTDGGQTWEPMRIILDMNNWGGKPEEENGVGDPSILVDDITGTIWVAALWIHGFPGQIAWNASGQGIEPDVTGQLVMVKSEDDGLSWSEVMNITPQIKDPAWKLMFQGPGRGITLNDGTLVFPAQFRDSEGIPWSTIIYSKDHGITWNIGTGAKPNTTEAQCVQLTDGSIMLNMRDNRNATIKDDSNGRAVAITRDLGKTWEIHPSSNNALPEPVCMASIISADLDIGGKTKKVLFFSNPANKYERKNITIKASLDEGLTWPETCQIEIYRPESFGYSCLTMVDKNTIGILYEGKKDLYFQKIYVKDVLE